ncbi:MAG: hypothetical protein GC186_19265 [Rhodobacteraceae bacterium]|nr:hypothetical protein [Paracoccaceae bacterium]
MAPLVKDYLSTFSDSSWPEGQKELDVIKFSTFFLTKMSDRTLLSVLNFVQAHHFGLAIEAGVLTYGPSRCGYGVEGFHDANFLRDLLRRIKRLGGVVSYLAMDEPLYFGHFATSFWKPNGGLCRFSIPELASNASGTLRDATKIFPKLKIGDIEPIINELGRSDAPPNYNASLQIWLDDFQAAFGRKLDFVHFDIAWYNESWGLSTLDADEGWILPLTTAAALIRSNGVRLGVIYNGSTDDASNLEWEQDAKRHFEMIEGELELIPDDAVIQSWDKYPNRAGPESVPGTLMNVLLSYLRWASSRPIAPRH